MERNRIMLINETFLVLIQDITCDLDLFVITISSSTPLIYRFLMVPSSVDHNFQPQQFDISNIFSSVFGHCSSCWLLSTVINNSFIHFSRSMVEQARGKWKHQQTVNWIIFFYGSLCKLLILRVDCLLSHLRQPKPGEVYVKMKKTLKWNFWFSFCGFLNFEFQ